MPFQFLRNDMMMGGAGLADIWSALPIPGATLDLDFAEGRWGQNLGPNLVTNGTFDTDNTGWVISFTGTLTNVAGRLRVVASGGGSQPRAVQTINNLTIGATYSVTATVAERSPATVASQFLVTPASTGSTGGMLGSSSTGNGLRTETFTFVATATTLYLALMAITTTAAEYVGFDDVSLRQVDPQSLGPEKITNGTFDANITGWTAIIGATWSAGTIRLASDGANQGSASQGNTTFVVGRNYVLTADVVAGGNVAGYVKVMDGAILVAQSLGQAAGTTITLPFTATNTSHTIFLRCNSSGGTATTHYDNVSVREVDPPIERIITTVRASPGMAQRLDGSWVDFAANVPRITDRGLLSEEARTNGIRNNTMQGAVVGNPGGTLPTGGWLTNGLSTVRSVLSLDPVGGIDTIELSFVGTPSANGTFYVDTTGTQTIVAAPGETWTGSVWFQDLNLDPAITTSMNLQIYALNSAGSQVGVLAQPILADRAVWKRHTLLYPNLPALTAYVMLRVSVGNGQVGVPVNHRFRIGLPQLEVGAFATSPIRTNGTAATRQADIITPPAAALTALQQSQGTMYAEIDEALGYFFPRIIDSYGATANNQNFRNISVNASGTGAAASVRLSEADAGGTQTIDDSATLYARGRAKVAGAWSLADLAVCHNGDAVTPTVTARTIAAPTQAFLGGRTDAQRQLGGYLRRVAFYPTRLTNAQLQTLTS